jgi:hypothetical protein
VTTILSEAYAPALSLPRGIVGPKIYATHEIMMAQFKSQEVRA